jgi:predicted RNA methylase
VKTRHISLSLAQATVKLTCVDASSEMLAVLKENPARYTGLLDKMQVVQTDVRQPALHRQFDLVLLPFQSFVERSPHQENYGKLWALSGDTCGMEHAIEIS